MVAQPHEPAHFPEQVERRVLRVLAGPQAGAEVALRDGIYLVGTADGCDIVLFDDSVAATHLAISVSQDATDIEARDGAIALPGGTLQPGERANVDEAVAFTLGATSIGLGDHDTDWASLTVPNAPQLVEAEPDEDDATETGDDTDETPEEPEAAAPEETAAPVAVTTDKPSRRLWLLAPLALLLLVVPAGAWFYVEGRETTGETTAAPGSSEPAVLSARVRDIVAGLKLTEVTVDIGEGGSISLRGYVPDNGRQVELQQALQAAGIDVADHLRSAGELVDQTRLTLANYGWTTPGFGTHLHVSYGGYGTVFVDGYLGPQVDRTTLRRQILGDVPGIAALRFRQADIGYWIERLQANLVQAGLGHWLTVSAEHGDIRITGELTEKEARTWREVGEAFVKESDGWPKLDIAVRMVRPGHVPAATSAAPASPEAPTSVEPVGVPAAPSAPQIDAPDITVVGVITSGSGFKRVLLSDGATLGEGDTVEDKFTVAEIHADRVVLRAEGRSFTYHVKEAR